jgi:hypothetical protein
VGGDPELFPRIVRSGGAAGFHQPGPLELGQGRVHLASIWRMQAGGTGHEILPEAQA